MKINPEKIRDVIGKGGVVVRGLQEETGTTIEIDDDGTISIASVSSEGGEAAKRKIQEIVAEVEVGKVYNGTVLRLLDFGAIVSLMPGKDGLLHISQISHQRVNSVADHLKEGQQVKVKVLEADEKGRVRLSMKAVTEQPAPAAETASQLAVFSGSEKGRRGAPFVWPSSELRGCRRWRGGLFGDLALAHLVESLAVDAERRGRPRFEPLQADLGSAALAVAVVVGVDAHDGLVDLLDQLALAVAVAKLERHVGLLARAVVRVGEHGRLVLHRVDSALDVRRQLLAQRIQHLLKCARCLAFMYSSPFFGA